MRLALFTATMACFVFGLSGCGDKTDQGQGPGPKVIPGMNKPASDNPLDVTYISEDYIAAVVVHPQRILKAPLLASFPMEKFLPKIIEEINLDPHQIEQVIILGDATLPAAAGGQRQQTPPPSAIVRLVDSADAEQIFSKIAKTPLKVGQTYEDDGTARHLVDKQTALVGPEAAVKKMLSAKGVDSPLTRQLRSVDADNDVICAFVLGPVREELKALAKQAEGLARNPDGEVSQDVADAASLPEKIDGGTMTVDLRGKTLINVVLDATDEAAASEMNALAEKGLEQGKKMYQEGGRFLLGLLLTAELAELKDDILKVADGLVAGITASNEGRQFSVVVSSPPGLVDLSKKAVPVLVAKAEKAAHRTASANNLKQIGLAFHNHHDVRNDLPPHANYDKDGKPLLSWRVHILPFLEQSALYDQFHLDEPWDSPHNSKLIEKMPDVYALPGEKLEEGKTCYVVVNGENTLFPKKASGKDPKESTRGLVTFGSAVDGLSNTIAVVEAAADKAVVWSKPDDLDDAMKDLKSALLDRGGKFLALFLDATTRQIPVSVQPEVLRALLGRNDQKGVDFDTWQLIDPCPEKTDTPSR